MAAQSGEKTEKPTPKRKKDSRKEGQIARSNDLPAWLSILAATWLIPWTLRQGLEQGAIMLRGITEVPGGGEAAMLGFFGDAMVRGALIAAPLVLMAMVLGVLGQVAQIGWAPKKLKPDLKRLNPLKGIKNIFGPQLAWESAKNLLKLSAVVVMALAPLREAYNEIYGVTAVPTAAVASVAASAAVGFIRNVAILGLVIAAFDYMQSKKRTDKQVKMTKQEVKEEHKQQEGDPLVKSQIRQRQMAMSRNRMMAEVPNADVVLANPTHVAVALRYDPLLGAPTVLAKGAGAVAARIREVADEEGIAIVRDVPLARTVYRLVDVGGQIPVELYEAVARVLAFVYALRRKGRARGTHDSPFVADHEVLTELPRSTGRRRPAAAGTR